MTRLRSHAPCRAEFIRPKTACSMDESASTTATAASRFIAPLAALLLFGLAPACAEPIGRLFLSPDERAMLERQRNDAGTASTPAGRITLNGLVRRSSGKTTAWINQRPQNEDENPQGVAVLKAPAKSSAALLLPSGKRVDLKVGQTLDMAQGTVRESYGDAVAAPSSKPAR